MHEHVFFFPAITKSLVSQWQDGHVNELSIVLPLESDSYILDLRLHRYCKCVKNYYFVKFTFQGFCFVSVENCCQMVTLKSTARTDEKSSSGAPLMALVGPPVDED